MTDSMRLDICILAGTVLIACSILVVGRYSAVQVLHGWSGPPFEATLETN